MTVESKPTADASVGELMGQLSAQTSRLIRDEMRLAQKEFQESAKHAGIGAGLFSVAGLLTFFGVATVIAAAVAALALVLEVWAAALIVAAVLFVAAAIAALIGRKQAEEITPTAPRTVETVKADIQELKDVRKSPHLIPVPNPRRTPESTTFRPTSSRRATSWARRCKRCRGSSTSRNRPDKRWRRPRHAWATGPIR